MVTAGLVGGIGAPQAQAVLPPTITVSSFADLQTAMAASPTDGTLYVIEVDTDFTIPSSLPVPVGTNITLEGNDAAPLPAGQSPSITLSRDPSFTAPPGGNNMAMSCFRVSGTLTVLDLVLDGGGIQAPAPAVAVETDATFNLGQDAIIQNFYTNITAAGDGGAAIRFAQGTTSGAAINITDNAKLLNNKAAVNGGAILVPSTGNTNDSINISGTAELAGNMSGLNATVSSTGGGAAIAMGGTGGSSLTIKDQATIHDNSALSGTGGAIFVNQNNATATVTISGDVQIYDNIATRGGAIADFGNSAIVTNKVYLSGNVNIYGNVASQTGGGVWVAGGVLGVSGDVKIHDNIAAGSLASPPMAGGGGISVQVSSAVVTIGGSTQIFNNHAIVESHSGDGAGVGGGLSIAAGVTSPVVISGGVKIDGNTAATNGGGIYNLSTVILQAGPDASGVMASPTVSNNQAGEVFTPVPDTDAPFPAILNPPTTPTPGTPTTKLLFNADGTPQGSLSDAGGNGGGIYNGGAFTMTDGTVVDSNTAVNAPGTTGFGLGGGIYVPAASTSTTISAGTISHNTASGPDIMATFPTGGTPAPGAGGGIYTEQYGKLLVGRGGGTVVFTGNMAPSVRTRTLIPDTWDLDSNSVPDADDYSTTVGTTGAIGAGTPVQIDLARMQTVIGVDNNDAAYNNYDINYTSGTYKVFFLQNASPTDMTQDGWSESMYDASINDPQNSEPGPALQGCVADPSRAGFTFLGWNTVRDGSGTNDGAVLLNPGTGMTGPTDSGQWYTCDIVGGTGNFNVYAQWVAKVTYDANAPTSGAGAYTGTVPTDSTVYGDGTSAVNTDKVTVLNSNGTGSTATTADGTLTRTGYVFAGWSTDSNTSPSDPGLIQPGDTTSVNTDDGDVTLYAIWGPLTPNVQIVKSVQQSEVANGDSIDYTITVTNPDFAAGSDSVAGPATNVVVSDPVPANTSLVTASINTADTTAAGVTPAAAITSGTPSWTIPTLNVGEQVVFNVEVTATAGSTTDPVSADNTATVTWTDPKDDSNHSGDSTVTTQIDVPAISVVKSGKVDTSTLDATGNAVAGQTQVDYTVTASNSGNTTLSDVTLSDTKLGASGLTCESVTLADGSSATCVDPLTLNPGDAATFTGTYTLTASDISTGSVVNDATATGNPPGCDPTIDSSCQISGDGKTTTYVDEPPSAGPMHGLINVSTDTTSGAVTSIDLSPVGPVGSVVDGVQGTFDNAVQPVVGVITDANGDPVASGVVTSTVNSDGSVTFSSTQPGVYTVPVTYTDSNGQQVTVDHVVTVIAPDSYSTPSNTPVDLSVLDNDGNSGDSLTVTANTNPSHGTLACSDGSATPCPAGDYVYTPNTGFTGDDSFTYTDCDAAGNCTPTTVTITVTSNPVTVTFDTQGGSTPPPDQTFENGLTPTQPSPDPTKTDQTFEGWFTDPTCGTNYDFTAPVTTDTTVYACWAGISVVKSADPSDQSSYTVGQQITYSFVATNTGDMPLTGVAVTDTGFTGTGTLGPVTCPADGTSWPQPTVGTLNPGDQVTCTAVYTLTQPDVDAGSVDNTGVATGAPPVTADNPNPAPVTSQDPMTIPAPQTSALTLVKTAATVAGADASTVGVNPGDTVDYTLTATNSGNTTLTDVVITDDMGLDGWTCSPDASASVIPGGTVVCTGTYTVPASGMTSVTNNASVTGSPLNPNDPTPDPQNATVTVPVHTPPTATPETGLITVSTDARSNTTSVTLDGKPQPGDSPIDLTKTTLGTIVADPSDPSADPSALTVTLNPDGTITVTSTKSGVFDIPETYVDGNGLTITIIHKVTVIAPDSGKTTAAADKTKAGQSVAIQVLSNDGASGTGLTVTDVKQPGDGTVSFDKATGQVTYTPNPGFSGIDTFMYEATDPQGNVAWTTVTIDVTPKATDDTATTPENTPVTIDVTSNDAGTSLTPTAVTQPANGTVVIVGGKVVYTPNPGFSGTDTFTYTVTDAAGQTTTATVTVTVTATAPVTDIANPGGGNSGNTGGSIVGGGSLAPALFALLLAVGAVIVVWRRRLDWSIA